MIREQLIVIIWDS